MQLIHGVNIIPIYTGDDAAIPAPLQIPQQPHPLPLGRMQGPLPLPSLADILDDLVDNYEISRERVDTLGHTVEILVRWHVQLRNEIDGMRRQHAQEIDSIHRQHAQEIYMMHRQHAQEIDRIHLEQEATLAGLDVNFDMLA